jgi:hypothetical protein
MREKLRNEVDRLLKQALSHKSGTNAYDSVAAHASKPSTVSRWDTLPSLKDPPAVREWRDRQAPADARHAHALPWLRSHGQYGLSHSSATRNTAAMPRFNSEHAHANASAGAGLGALAKHLHHNSPSPSAETKPAYAASGLGRAYNKKTSRFADPQALTMAAHDARERILHPQYHHTGANAQASGAHASAVGAGIAGMRRTEVRRLASSSVGAQEHWRAHEAATFVPLERTEACRRFLNQYFKEAVNPDLVDKWCVAFRVRRALLPYSHQCVERSYRTRINVSSAPTVLASMCRALLPYSHQCTAWRHRKYTL